MIDCIKELYDNKELGPKFSDEAFNYYLSNFTREKHINSFKSCLMNFDFIKNN